MFQNRTRVLPGSSFLVICIFLFLFIMTVAGKFACLHLPVNTLKEIISSLMKALFECLQIFCVWRQNSPLVVWTCTLISAQLRPDTTETSSVSLSQNKTDVFQLFCLWRDRQSWFQLICSIVWWKDELVHTMWVFERATRRCLTFCQWKQSVYLCEPVYSPHFHKFPDDLAQLWCLISNEVSNSAFRHQNC